MDIVLGLLIINCITRLRVEEEHADTLTYKSVVQSALFVAEHLVQDKAVLLPHVCRYFLTCYGVKSQNVSLTLEENDCTVKFLLLGQLIIYLNPHMQYICVHKRFGTMNCIVQKVIFSLVPLGDSVRLTTSLK